MEDKVLLRCSCGTEFIEIERYIFAEDEPETAIFIYHMDTSIKWSIWAKIKAIYNLIVKGRALIYDIVLTDAELKKLQVWMKSKKL